MDTEKYLDLAERRRLDRLIADRLSALRTQLDLEPEATSKAVEARVEELLIDLLHLISCHNNSGPQRTMDFLQAVADHAKEIYRREQARLRSG